MSQDREAMIVLVLGILFCLIIIIASYSSAHSTIQIIDQRYDEGAAFQYGLALIGLEPENKDNLLNG
jgi:hypothetical protein